MTKPALEVEELVDALRADLPSDADRERVRARLLAAGVAISAGVAASSTSVAAAAGAGASGAAATGSAKAGLMSQLAGLSLAAKVSMVTTVVAVTVGLPIAATRMHDAPAREARAVVAQKTRAHAGEARPIAPVTPPPAALIVQVAPSVQVDARVGADHAAEETVAVAPPAVANTRVRATRRELPRAQAVEARATEDAAPNAALPTEPATTAPIEAVAQTPAVELAATPQAPAPSTLIDEADLLERALGALRRGDRAHAREALDLHAQRYARGALAHERERILQRINETP